MQYSYENPIQYKQIVDHGIRAAGCIILLLLICVCGWESHASADCADIKITTKQQVVSKGDTVYVMVTVTSTTAMSGFEGFLHTIIRYCNFRPGEVLCMATMMRFRYPILTGHPLLQNLNIPLNLRRERLGIRKLH